MASAARSYFIGVVEISGARDDPGTTSPVAEERDGLVLIADHVIHKHEPRTPARVSSRVPGTSAESRTAAPGRAAAVR